MAPVPLSALLVVQLLCTRALYPKKTRLLHSPSSFHLHNQEVEELPGDVKGQGCNHQPQQQRLGLLHCRHLPQVRAPPLEHCCCTAGEPLQAPQASRGVVAVRKERQARQQVHQHTVRATRTQGDASASERLPGLADAWEATGAVGVSAHRHGRSANRALPYLVVCSADPNTQGHCQAMSAPASGPSERAYTSASRPVWFGVASRKRTTAAFTK